MITFKHSGHIGDVICSLPFVKAACEKFKTKAVLFLNKGILIGTDYDTDGPKPAITEESYNFIKPLLEKQTYIDSVVDQSIHVDYNLDDFRRFPVSHRYGHLPLHYMQMFHIYYDYAKPWLTIDQSDLHPFLHDKIILGRSHRSINPRIKYDIEDAYFIGLDSEFETIKEQTINLQRLKVANAYEVACYIESCKLYVGNASFNFTIAEGLKKNRIFEMSNVQSFMPCGDVIYLTDQKLKDLIENV